MIEVELPDGTVVEIETDDPQIAAQAARKFLSKSDRPKMPGGSLAASNRGIEQGLSLGFGDEIAAGVMTPFEMAAQAIRGDDVSISGAYGANLDRERQMLNRAREEAPLATGVGELAGGVVTGGGLAGRGVTMAGRLGAGLGGRVGSGIAEGAGYGAAYGFGSGEGASDRISGAVTGAGLGAAVGGAVPAVAATARAATKPVVDAIKARTDPEGFTTSKVSERLGMSPEQAGNRLADAQKRGQNLSLADVGAKSARGLLRTTTNIPGPAQDRVATQLNVRQMGQGDRLKSLVKATFADPDGYITAKDRLAKAWSEAGDDLYEPAMKKNVVWTDRLKQFVDEPIFKRGLAQGVKIQRLESLAKGEKFDPMDYAITGFNEAGDPIISGIPNMRTLNVAKKGIDAIIGDMKNPITGKLTEEGRATDMVRRAFLKELDSWNPEYKKAREVWGGFAKLNEAVEWGRKEALRTSPEAVRTTLKDMSLAEKQAARVGVADALRDKIDRAGYTNNAILRIFSNRQNTGILKELFPEKEAFATFRRSIFDEARKRATYDAVKGNSTTVRQAADLAESGGLNDMVNVGAAAVTQGPVGATLQFLSTRLKMLGGMTPQVADRAAKMLMERDPSAVRQITAQLDAIGRRQLSATARRRAVEDMLSRVLPLPAVGAAQ